MANAFISLSRLFAAFRPLLAYFAPGAAQGGPGTSAPAQQRAAAEPPRHHALKPLRVVRVVEPCAPRSTAGRMVISGRLADVCAELDRLAALEAQGC
jgi:hypothetical protein